MTHPNEPAPSACFSPIRIAAAVIADAKGRILLVRKRSSFFFMQPGGKREEGETALETLARELNGIEPRQTNNLPLAPLTQHQIFPFVLSLPLWSTP